MQTKSTDSFKQQRHRAWMSCFTILLGLPLLTSMMVYIGYCWGLWGRESLLFQYLFQCNCPAASEEARYPKSIDIIVPACSYLGSMLSPTGNLLYVIEGESKFTDTFSSTYLLDLRTNEKIPFFVGLGSNSFLTDDLLFLSLYYGHEGYEGGDYILDRTTGKQYPIQPFIFLREDAYIDSQPNLEVLAMELRNTQDVYLIDNEAIVALKSDFETFPKHSFYIDTAILPGNYPDQDEIFLQGNHIDYHTVPSYFQEEALSPDGRFIARRDGIYLSENGERIVAAYTVRGIIGEYFSVQGWTSDSIGVIYYKFLDGCLLKLPSYDGGTCFIPVRQPLLKLKVPEEYLPPNQRR